MAWSAGGCMRAHGGGRVHAGQHKGLHVVFIEGVSRLTRGLHTWPFAVCLFMEDAVTFTYFIWNFVREERRVKLSMRPARLVFHVE